jgi:hypothetical protein
MLSVIEESPIFWAAFCKNYSPDFIELELPICTNPCSDSLLEPKF